MRLKAATWSGLISLVLASFVGLPAAADTANPVVVVDSGTVSPSSVAPGSQLTVSWRVTDDASCCSWTRIHILRDADPTNDALAWDDAAVRVSGSVTDGIYRTTFIVPPLPNGTFELRAQVIDQAGKYSNFGRVAKFNVINSNQTALDTANPVIVMDSGVLSASTVAPNDNLTVTWRVTDDVGCCTFNRLNFMSNDSVVWFTDNPTQTAGTSTNATFSKTFQVPNIPDGVYDLRAQVIDNVGKYSGLDRVARITVRRNPPPDLANPVLVLGSGTVSKNQVRVGESLTVTWRITDDVDCCNFNRINVMPAGGSNLDIRFFSDQVSRVSGDGRDGVYSATFSVPSLPVGNYSLRAQATDKAGKYTNLSEIATFSVVSNADVANPVVVPNSARVSPSTANPGDRVTLQYQVTDDLDCCNPHDAYMYDAQGNWVLRNQARLISGTKTNGTYQVDFQLPLNMVPGVYTFRSQVTDLAGKFSELQLLGSLRVAGTDRQDPAIVSNSASLSKSSLTSGESLTVTYTATDDLGGFAPHDALVYDQNNNLVLRATATRVSGDSLRATFRSVFALTDALPSGQYTVRAQVTDNAGRVSNLQILGTFTFTSSAVRPIEISRATGLASPSIVSPGETVRITFTILNDSNEVTASAVVKNANQSVIATGPAIRLFRGVGLGQYYADVSIPALTPAGVFVFAATALDRSSGMTSTVDLGSFQVQSSVTVLQAPQNLRFVDGRGVVASTLNWDAPLNASSNSIRSYLVEAMTTDGSWTQICSTMPSSRSCNLTSRVVGQRLITAYRVAAVGVSSVGVFGSISQPANLSFVGDPVLSNDPSTLMPSNAKITVVAERGRIVVRAQGLNGYTLTWQVNGRIQRATVTKDSQSFSRTTSRRGVRTTIEVFINDAIEPAFKRTITTR